MISSCCSGPDGKNFVKASVLPDNNTLHLSESECVVYNNASHKNMIKYI